MLCPSTKEFNACKLKGSKDHHCSSAYAYRIDVGQRKRTVRTPWA